MEDALTTPECSLGKSTVYQDGQAAGRRHAGCGRYSWNSIGRRCGAWRATRMQCWERRGGKEKMDGQHDLPLVDILVLEDERTVSDDAGLQT